MGTVLVLIVLAIAAGIAIIVWRGRRAEAELDVLARSNQSTINPENKETPVGTQSSSDRPVRLVEKKAPASTDAQPAPTPTPAVTVLAPAPAPAPPVQKQAAPQQPAPTSAPQVLTKDWQEATPGGPVVRISVALQQEAVLRFQSDQTISGLTITLKCGGHTRTTKLGKVGSHGYTVAFPATGDTVEVTVDHTVKVRMGTSHASKHKNLFDGWK